MKITKRDFLFAAMLLNIGAIPYTYADNNAPLSYVAAPETYKLLDENARFRVIMQNSKPGHRDAWHSHSALAIYRLSDCSSRIYELDGKYRDGNAKAGHVAFLPAVASHSFENTGKKDCKALIVEQKE